MSEPQDQSIPPMLSATVSGEPTTRRNGIGLSLAGDAILHIYRADTSLPWSGKPAEPLDVFIRVPDKEYVVLLTPAVVERLVAALRGLGVEVAEVTP